MPVLASLSPNETRNVAGFAPLLGWPGIIPGLLWRLMGGGIGCLAVFMLPDFTWDLSAVRRWVPTLCICHLRFDTGSPGFSVKWLLLLLWHDIGHGYPEYHFHLYHGWPNLRSGWKNCEVATQQVPAAASLMHITVYVTIMVWRSPRRLRG